MEIVNFIQGRVPRTILERHYLNLYALALRYYPKYAEWLKGNFLINEAEINNKSR